LQDNPIFNPRYKIKSKMKKLKTGISTEIVNGRVEVYTEKEALQKEQGAWWQKVLKKNELQEVCRMSKFLIWYEKIQNVNFITNEQFERINNKLN
jgi:hypothetical protein